MTDKVQLIKEEIERRIKEGSSKNDISEGALALDSLLDFINSLPEEHSELKKDYRERYEKLSQSDNFKQSYCNKSLGGEEYNEDLEEEMIRWHKEHFGNKRDWEKTSGEYLTRKSQLDIARHFAEWGKTHK